MPDTPSADTFADWLNQRLGQPNFTEDELANESEGDRFAAFLDAALAGNTTHLSNLDESETH